MAIDRLQVRRGTAAEWTSANPVLADGEPGFERDTGKIKYGDGVTAWPSLPYASVGPQGIPGVADDASVQDLIANPSSATRGELNATYVGAFEPSTSIVYDPTTGAVTSSTEGGITTTYTYNADGTVNTETRLGLVRTWAYDGSGNPTSSTVV